MNYKDWFIKLNIKTVEDCFKYLYNIMFGFMDIKGNVHKGANDEFNYSLQTPFELHKNKFGICWDVVEFARAFFENMTNYVFETYYIFYEDGKGCPSHTFLVYYDDSKIFLFEPTAHHCSYPFSGISSFDNIDELLSFVVDAFIKNSIGNGNVPADYDKNKIFVYKYSKPKEHINGSEMRKHINNSEKIEVSYDRKSI